MESGLAQLVNRKAFHLNQLDEITQEILKRQSIKTKEVSANGAEKVLAKIF